MEQTYIDFKDALDRFDGNESFFRRLLLKYPQDPHFDRLNKAFACKDFDEARKEIHTLKGVSGNLSLKTLYTLSTQMNEILVQGNTQQAQDLLPSLQEAQAKTIAAISNL